MSHSHPKLRARFLHARATRHTKPPFDTLTCLRSGVRDQVPWVLTGLPDAGSGAWQRQDEGPNNTSFLPGLLSGLVGGYRLCAP